jgi:hypothetical protein
MPIKRYCELCKAELPPGVLSFGFELHVKTVGKEAELKKLVTISGEYCTKCTTEGAAYDNLIQTFSNWFAAETDRNNQKAVPAAAPVPPGET